MLTLILFFFLNINSKAAPNKVDSIISTKSQTNKLTFYIDNTGNDHNDGTDSLHPWKTLAKVNAIVWKPGSRILLKSGGVWNETLSLTGKGKKDALIIIDKYGGDKKPIINGGGDAQKPIAVWLRNADYWEIHNLEVTNTSNDSHPLVGIQVDGGADNDDLSFGNILISNCYVHDVNAATVKQKNYKKTTGGIILQGRLHDINLSNCHISKCSVEGIRTAGLSGKSRRSENIIIENNLIEHIYGDAIVMAQVSGGCKILHNTVYDACMTNDINFAGIWTVASKNTLIAFNEVYGMKGGGPNDGMAFDADGWDDISATNGDIFEYNYSHDNNGGFFLFMAKSNNIIVRYNVSVNDVGKIGNKKLFLIEQSQNTNRFVYNNVFYIKNPTSKLMWKGAGATFTNNIFYTESTVDKLCDVPLTSASRFYNNCFYPSSTFKKLNWNDAINQNNLYENPLFKKPNNNIGWSAALGFNLSDSSPCRSAGKWIKDNGGKDYEQKALNKKRKNIGAFQ